MTDEAKLLADILEELRRARGERQLELSLLTALVEIGEAIRKGLENQANAR